MTERAPARGWVDPNWPSPGGDGDASIIIYGYTPSFALAVLGCVLFLIAGIAHSWQLFKYRSWYFSTMLVGILFVSRTFPPHPQPHQARRIQRDAS